MASQLTKVNNVGVGRRLAMTLLLWSIPAAYLQAKDVERSATNRVADILEVRHLDNKKIRIIFSAQENNGSQRFPISTIDRSMVRINFANVSAPPADVESLTLNGSGSAELKRAMFVGFSLNRKLKTRAIDEIRADVGELLKQLPAEMLTVAAISEDSARVIADVTPQKSDNINRILQQLQSLDAEGEGPAMANTLCVAAERFHAWDLSGFRKADQKVLIMLSPPGDSPSTERFRGQNCWRSLLDQGVRVFFVSFGDVVGISPFDLSAVAQDSGGYVHRVSGPVEMNAAVKNVIALLQNEYAVDVQAPSIAVDDQPLELSVSVTYHDTTFESNVFNVGFVIPELGVGVASARSIKSDSADSGGDYKDDVGRSINHQALILGGVLIALMSIAIIVMLRRRGKKISCSSCRATVKPDHSDCPFRRPNCTARLVYIGGPYAGQTIPLQPGETILSKMRLKPGSISISGRGVSWLHHGSIMVDGSKAIYTPSKPARDRINGWLVGESRLLGLGSVLKLGDQNLRFEVKVQGGTR